MKSGLGDRNNPQQPAVLAGLRLCVSMKSGLGDRNNNAEGDAYLLDDTASQ